MDGKVERQANSWSRHTTPGVKCAHCGIGGHTVEQCWSKNSQNNPFQGRLSKPQSVNMARLNHENRETDRQWQAEQLEREKASAQY